LERIINFEYISNITVFGWFGDGASYPFILGISYTVCKYTA
jgi:hypothetical protein